MSDATRKSLEKIDAGKTDSANNNAETQREDSKPVKEIGGRDGPDPTRYGDREKAGRCVDF